MRITSTIGNIYTFFDWIESRERKHRPLMTAIYSGIVIISLSAIVVLIINFGRW